MRLNESLDFRGTIPVYSLKTEFTNHEMFQTKAKANEMIFEYIEVFYNRQRMHSSNNYLPPVEFEEKMLLMEMVA